MLHPLVPISPPQAKNGVQPKQVSMPRAHRPNCAFSQECIRKEVKPPPILTCTQTNPFLLTLPVCGEKETEHERLLRKTLHQQREGSLFSCTEQ